MRSKIALYVDCRCLQESPSGWREIAQHAEALLRTRQRSGLRNASATALVDRLLPPLPRHIAELFDRATFSLNPTFTGSASIFIDLSPMTHNPAFTARFVSHEFLMSGSVVHDFVPLDWPGYLNTVRDAMGYMLNLGA